MLTSRCSGFSVAEHRLQGVQASAVAAPALYSPGSVVWCTGLVGLPRWLSGKESTVNADDAGDTGSIPGSGRSPRGTHSSILA